MTTASVDRQWKHHFSHGNTLLDWNHDGVISKRYICKCCGVSEGWISKLAGEPDYRFGRCLECMNSKCEFNPCKFHPQ